MCGIAGVFLFRDQGSKIKREELLAARDRMHSRGPDDCGLWMSDSTEIALAHRRLSILDLSEAGRQPMARDGGRLQICYNGEVYNFKELRSELKGKGHSFRSDTDTEVLLAMYREYGPEFVVKLRGMFAIAIWDDDRKTLSLARDPFGIKPLYFSLHANGIYFASQVRALLAFSAIDRELDPIGQCGFFLLGSVPEPHTLFRAIRQLAPGSVMEVSAERGPKIVYEVDVEHLCADASVARQGEARASVDFNAALEQSVAAHLVSDAPIGFFVRHGSGRLLR